MGRVESRTMGVLRDVATGTDQPRNWQVDLTRSITQYSSAHVGSTVSVVHEEYDESERVFLTGFLWPMLSCDSASPAGNGSLALDCFPLKLKPILRHSRHARKRR